MECVMHTDDLCKPVVGLTLTHDECERAIERIADCIRPMLSERGAGRADVARRQRIFAAGRLLSYLADELAGGRDGRSRTLFLSSIERDVLEMATRKVVVRHEVHEVRPAQTLRIVQKRDEG